MSTDEPSVPIVCTECETETSVALSDVADALEKHNEGKHDGEEIATRGNTTARRSPRSNRR